MYYCVVCSGEISEGRHDLGYKLCLSCGESAAKNRKHTVVPLHKSNYMLVTDPELLLGINNKGGLVR